MRSYTKSRDRIINRIGLAGGFPAIRLETGVPAFLKPGDAEAGCARVAWPEFFDACESRELGLLADDSEPGGELRLMRRSEAQGLLRSSRAPLGKRILDFIRAFPAVDAG
jgi:hypothetical protein